MNRCFIFTGLLWMLSSLALAQQPTGIYIGQRVDSVQALIAQEVQTHYNAGGWLMKMNAQTIDFKGQVKEVILCKENVLMHRFNKGVNFCIHYIVSNDTLSTMVTHYSNLTFDEVKDLIVSDRTTTNMGGYYFNSDYKAYRRIYTTDNGSILVEYKKTVIGQLPVNVREQLRLIAGLW